MTGWVPDWVGTLLAISGCLVGSAISSKIRTRIPAIPAPLVWFMSVFILVFLMNAFPEHARIAAFVIGVALGFFTSGKKTPDGLEKCIHGFGCFKPDTDPRNMQPIDSERNLYIFMPGSLGINDMHLEFVSSQSIRGYTFHKKIDIRDITSIEWRPHVHRFADEETRYLIGGMFRPWAEVGHSRLPTFMKNECTIKRYDGTENYFYFSNTANNIKSLSEIREHIQAKQAELKQAFPSAGFF